MNTLVPTAAAVTAHCSVLIMITAGRATHQSTGQEPGFDHRDLDAADEHVWVESKQVFLGYHT